MARYSLSEYFSCFLESHPEPAIDAVIGAVEGYVARQHPTTDLADYRMVVEGNSIRLQKDWSYIWAHDPDSAYSHDADVLIVKLVSRLRNASVPDALVLARHLRDRASLAIFWSRLFMVASERDDALVDELWAIAAQEPFILLSDTRKDAIDLVGKGFMRRSVTDRIGLEEAALHFDFSDYTDPAEARVQVLRRLFNVIGRDNLCTEAAKEILKSEPHEEPVGNERLFVSQVGSRKLPPYFWISESEREAPSNQALITALEEANAILGLTANESDAAGPTLDQAFLVLDSIRDALAPSDITPALRINAEGVIGQGCAYIVTQKLLPSASNVGQAEDLTPHFLELLRVASQSMGPEVGEDTEQSFERNVAWGGPAARVEAAQALFDLLLQRHDLYEQLQTDIEAMLADPHPAVRLQAAIRLVRLWDIDRDGLWRRLIERLEQETNLGVVEHVVGSVVTPLLHQEPRRILNIIQDLLTRDESDLARVKRIRSIVCDKLTILWIQHRLEAANATLQGWIAQPAAYADELVRMITSVRAAMAIGLADTNDVNAELRGRALELVTNIVDAANCELEAHYARPESNELQLVDVRECARLIDTACMQLLFAAGARNGSYEQSGLDHTGLSRFLNQTEDLLMRIGDYAAPHTIYHLLELLEGLVLVDPERVFDLVAHALRRGTRSGFQYESMGIDLLVKLIGVFLADHKEVFEDEGRRRRLIDSLEILMEAGWPSARRLLYRLPELIQ